jgi:hypothetical protein
MTGRVAADYNAYRFRPAMLPGRSLIMLRATLCAVALFAAGSFARADELDKESAPAKSPVAKATTSTVAGTEMDKESPDAAYRYHGGWGGGYRGGYGYHGGWGYCGGYGYRPYYGGYGYRGFYRPYYGYGGTFISIGYPGFGFGYGYPYYW